MAYIGQSASGNFTTKPSKDTFSGNASTTAFTLSEGATTNTVDVFVNNVRQEPTTAYTVDGTTLTFTAAPGSGTNNIYVVNRGPLQLSATHPAAQALEASTGTFTGDLTVDTNTLHVDASLDGIGIGTTTVRNIGPDYKGLNLNGTVGGYIDFSSNGTRKGTIFTNGTDLVFDTVDPAVLAFLTGSSERVRIDSNGLKFNGDTAAANALDDYEEGTWTPTSVSNIDAISSVEGFYTKIGNLVTVVYIASIDPTSTSSFIKIGGLPYAVADKLSGTGIQGTGVVFEDNTMFIHIAIEASSNIQIEFDRPIQGTASALQRIYRGSLTYFAS